MQAVAALRCVAAARSGLTRRPAAPCRGPASGVLPLPRACCWLLLLAVDVGQRNADERSLRATDHRGGKSLRKRCLQKSRALGPPQARKKRVFSAPQA